MATKSPLLLVTALSLLVVSAHSESTRPSFPAGFPGVTDPRFSEKDYSIKDFGAAPDADCTAAIAAAVGKCTESGGGRVIVPAGEWKTGPIVLKSNVNLHLEDGATLKFDPDPKRYLPVIPTRFEGMDCMNYAPLIRALGETNVAITGKGTLDGGASAQTWWAWNQKGGEKPPLQTAARRQLDQQCKTDVPVEQRVYGEGSYLRPSFVEPTRCANVLIEGVTVVNSPMWELHPMYCTNVTIRGVTIKSFGPNNDGCDPESCSGVLIEGCRFETGDDCIAIKSGRNNDGRRVNIPCKDIAVRRCVMKDGHGGVTMGSEISGGVQNVLVEDCEMDSPNLDRAIRFKSNAVRGGVIQNVRVHNLKIGTVKKGVLSVEFNYEEGPVGPFKPVLKDVTLENVTCESAGRNMIISSFPGAEISNILLKDCKVSSVAKPDELDHCGQVTLENVSLYTASKAADPGH